MACVEMGLGQAYLNLADYLNGNSCQVVSKFILKFFIILHTWATAYPTICTMRPVKTQISLGIHPVWSASSLSTWWNLGSSAILRAHSEGSDQTGCTSFCWFCHAVAHIMILSIRTDRTGQTEWQLRVYTVCHSIWIFLTHYSSMVKKITVHTRHYCWSPSQFLC